MTLVIMLWIIIILAILSLYWVLKWLAIFGAVILWICGEWFKKVWKILTQNEKEDK